MDCSALRVLALTQSRSATLLVAALRSHDLGLIVETIDPTTMHLGVVPTAQRAVALVELGLRMAEARALCRLVRTRWSDVPQLALLHCGHALEGWHLEMLLHDEIAGIIDMDIALSDLFHVLRTLAAGARVVQLHAPAATRMDLVGDAASGDRRVALDDEALLRLAAEGGSERELGRELQLSEHTVHRRLERVRSQLGLRNRIELAAWAGASGLYHSLRHPHDESPMSGARGDLIR